DITVGRAHRGVAGERGALALEVDVAHPLVFDGGGLPDLHQLRIGSLPDHDQFPTAPALPANRLDGGLEGGRAHRSDAHGKLHGELSLAMTVAGSQEAARPRRGGMSYAESGDAHFAGWAHGRSLSMDGPPSIRVVDSGARESLLRVRCRDLAGHLRAPRGGGGGIPR